MPYYPLATVRSTRPPDQKQRPVLGWPRYDSGEWNWTITSYDNYVQKGYEKNAIIYSAIAYKQRSISQAPLRPYEGNFQQHEMVDLNHPSWIWCLRPNESQSMVEFMQQAICYFNLSGNCYIYIDRNPDGSVKALYNLRPDRVKLLFSTKEFKGFLYCVENRPDSEGLPMLPNRVMHIKLPNPRDPYEGMGYGLSPIMPSAQPADVDNYVTQFLYRYFRTGIVSMGALVSKKLLTDSTRERLRDEWVEMHGGADNWSKPMVFEEDMTWQPLTPPFKDLDFKIVDARNEARILGPLGVPGMLLGLPGAMERSTYANMGEARRDFWETTFNPELQLFEVEFIYNLTAKDGVFPMFDTSEVPALQRDMPPLVDSAVKLISIGMPPYIAYRTTGLKTQRYPGDMVSRVPLSLQPVGTPAPALPGETAPAEETPEEETSGTEGGMEEGTEQEEQGQREGRSAAAPTDLKDWTPEEKALIWKRQDQIAQTYEGAFAEAAVAQFKRDHAEIAALLNRGAEKARSQKSSIQWMNDMPSINDYLTQAGEQLWRNTFLPLQIGLVDDVAHFWTSEIGLQFDIPNIEGMAWFQNYQLQFAQPINLTTSQNVHDLLQQAQAEGWSIDAMQNHLDQVFQQYMNGNLSSEDFQWFSQRMPAYRRELIARTETCRLQNAGSYNLLREWGVQQKEWLATWDSATRDSHIALNGQVRPINQPFDSGLGNQLMYPGDARAPLNDTANCRCTTIAKFPEERALVIRLKLKELEKRLALSTNPRSN